MSTPPKPGKSSTPAAPKTNYHYFGKFDRAIFQSEFVAQFGKSGRYSAGAMPDMLEFLGRLERDPVMYDVRHYAYMMATTYWETTSPTTVTHVVVDKKGKQTIVKQKQWLMTMAPVSEIGEGKGRKYHEPVKVKLLDDNSVRITEQDGDQFSVSPKGKITQLTKKAKMGTVDGGAATKTYEDDDGVEHAYFGRGYVQLTWWSNYASSGIAIGRGLDLLLDPDLVKSPEVAYALMSHGMSTGNGFANGHRFSNYFQDTKTDYTAARRMVNGHDHAAEIAAIAAKFEAILLKARIVATPLRPDQL